MITGIDHVGISVASLERSIRFYCDLLGMQLVARESFAGAMYDSIMALDGATGHVALLKSGSLQLELFEFAHPSGEAADPRYPVSRQGISHFGFGVDDIHREYERLRNSGVVFHCAPQCFDTTWATYGRDPDGNVFEIIEMASGAMP